MTIFTVYLDRPELVDDLVAALRGGGCRARRAGRRTCAVAHVDAANDAEARVELAFFLRAWQERHGAARVLLAS